MRRLLAATVTASLLLGFGGCATVGGLREEPIDAGQARTFAAAFRPTLLATQHAMAGSQIQVKEATELDSVTYRILGTRGASLGSWGEVVRIVVHGSTPDRTEVRVITKRRLATNVTAQGDWSQVLFDQIALEVGRPASTAP